MFAAELRLVPDSLCLGKPFRSAPAKARLEPCLPGGQSAQGSVAYHPMSNRRETTAIIEPLETRELLSAFTAEVSTPARTSAAVSAPIWGNVKHNGQSVRVGLLFADGAQRTISPRRPTWIVIHGWRSSPEGGAIPQLSSAIDGIAPRDQVLVLDWSQAANAGLFDAFGWVRHIGRFLAGKLHAMGLSGSRINLIGHSMGGFMAGLVAAAFPGSVNRIVVLDPAVDFVSTVDYAAHSRFSVALIGSSLATQAAARSADAAIRVKAGDFSSIAAHTNVVSLYASMVTAAQGAQADPISAMFARGAPTPAMAAQWRANAFAGGFEAVIAGRYVEGQWRAAALTYRRADNGVRVVVEAG